MVVQRLLLLPNSSQVIHCQEWRYDVVVPLGERERLEQEEQDKKKEEEQEKTKKKEKKQKKEKVEKKKNLGPRV